jgi:hypothetical protein
VAAALTRLERLGVLSRIKRSVLVMWHQGGRQRRQLANGYVLNPGRHCEFTGCTVQENERTLITVSAIPTGAVEAARAALRRVAAKRSLLLNKEKFSPAKI